MTAVNLYRVLGVSGKAGPETIRKAYRSKAKKAHPDAKGGSREAFDRIKLAHDILTDPARRARYDATGDVTESTPDAGRGPLFALIVTVLDRVLVEATKQNLDVATFDVVDAMTDVLADQADKLKDRCSMMERRRKSLERVRSRFRRRKAEDENVLGMLVEGSLATLASERHGTERAIDLTKEALTLVKEHAFDKDVAYVRSEIGLTLQVLNRMAGGLCGGTTGT